MSVRSRLSGTLTRAAKAVAPAEAPERHLGGEPPEMQAAARDVSQMTSDHPFAPGIPVGPFAGYGQTPRAHDFVTGTNIATRPRTHERVSFWTLRGLVESYDIAQIAIWHRIDSLRSLDWKLIAAEGYSGDVSDEVKKGRKALAKPDRDSSFEGWFAKWLYDILAYDAGALYRLRNRAGRCVGLAPVDGTTIAPLLDYWGRVPAEPAEAYVQYVNGLPWNWLTRGDLVYEPFRPRTSSPYGQAPLETVLLNANTDLRFQVYFLQRFTEGTIPEAFASAPEGWDPDQIERFQSYWDDIVYGDQAVKHQVKWIPGGSTFAWSNEKTFEDTFSLFLMRKTCAAYHTVPSDLGFTEDVNRSSGESQADVQHKVGEKPLGNYAERIISSHLQDDLGLPVQFIFDWGEEQDDRVAQAQADQIYVNMAAISSSDVRELRYGLPEPEGQPVPRYIFTERAGPIPLASLLALAGEIDPETAAPMPGSHLPHEAFPGIAGVMPNPALVTPPLAEQEFGPKALPAAPVPQPGLAVGKEAAAAITTGTGITGYDGPGDHDDDSDDQEDAAREALAKAELTSFRRYAARRRREGAWRDFRFDHATPVAGHNLNDAGRLAVRKDAGVVAVAGLAVLAEDTGRVLMLQRALADGDPAAGTWEFPGGHIEGTETPLQGAWREWAEETGAIPPPGVQAGTWVTPNGIYQGIVWAVPSEDSVPVRAGGLVANPDDPDGDMAEAIAWWNPGDLPGNPAVRPELLADIDAVMAALGCGPAAPCCGAACCQAGCCSGDGGCGCGSQVAKAGDGGDPKAPPPQRWAGWRLADQAAAYWAAAVLAAMAAALTPALLGRLAGAYLGAFPGQDGTAAGKQARNEAAREWLLSWLAGQGITLDLSRQAAGILADGYLAGVVSAAAVAGGGPADTGEWKPGDTDAATARAGDLGEGFALAALLTTAAGPAAAGLTAGVATALARVLAGAIVEAGRSALAAVLTATAADEGLVTGLVLDRLYATAGNAAADWYAGNVSGDFEWVTDPTLQNCAICLDNEAAEPRPFGQPWPSGDTNVSIHYKCGCALVPA